MGESRNGARVLIVDDSPDIALALGRLLEEEGYRVESAVGRPAIESALARAREEPPALVLLDVMMGGIDGAEVCRQLRADARTGAVKVVFLTALPEWQLADRLGGCRHDDLIRKPYDLDTVVAAVARHTAG